MLKVSHILTFDRLTYMKGPLASVASRERIIGFNEDFTNMFGVTMDDTHKYNTRGKLSHTCERCCKWFNHVPIYWGGEPHDNSHNFFQGLDNFFQHFFQNDFIDLWFLLILVDLNCYIDLHRFNLWVKQIFKKLKSIY